MLEKNDHLRSSILGTMGTQKTPLHFLLWAWLSGDVLRNRCMARLRVCFNSTEWAKAFFIQHISQHAPLQCLGTLRKKSSKVPPSPSPMHHTLHCIAYTKELPSGSFPHFPRLTIYIDSLTIFIKPIFLLSGCLLKKRDGNSYQPKGKNS